MQLCPSDYTRCEIPSQFPAPAASLHPAPSWPNLRHAPFLPPHPTSRGKKSRLKGQRGPGLWGDSEVTIPDLRQWLYLSLHRCLEDKKSIFQGTAAGWLIPALKETGAELPIDSCGIYNEPLSILHWPRAAI